MLQPLASVPPPNHKAERKLARKLLRKKEKRKERDRLILLAQKDRRKKRVEESSIAQQRLLSMMDTDYSQWIAEGYDNSKATNLSMTPPRLQVASTGVFETARTTAPETMLFHLLSRQSESIHPTFLGYNAARTPCKVSTTSPMWSNYTYTSELIVTPAVRHPAAGAPFRWLSDRDETVQDADRVLLDHKVNNDSDADPEEADVEGTKLRSSDSETDIETDESEKEDTGNENETTEEREEREAQREERLRQKREKKEQRHLEKQNRQIQKQLVESLLLSSMNSKHTHPVCWNRTRAPNQNQHPSFGHRFQTSLQRTQCNASAIHPSVWHYTMTRKPLPVAIHQITLVDATKQQQVRAPVVVHLPVGPVQCPVCKGQPGRLGRSGCPACWRNPQTLPWTFPARTMPGIFCGCCCVA